MKRIFMFLSVLFLVVPFAVAEASWQDSVIPPDHVQSAQVSYKIIPKETNIIRIGNHIPAGLYSISGFRFPNRQTIEVSYMFCIMRGTEVVYESELMNTDDNADLILPLFNGDCLIVATQFDNVVYLYSVEYSALKLY